MSAKVEQGETHPSPIGERAFFASPSLRPAVLPTAELTVAPVPVAGPTYAPKPIAAAAFNTISRALVAEWERGTAFLFAPVLMALGALIHFAAASEPAAMHLTLGLATLSMLAFAARRRFLLRLAFVAVVLVVLGMAFAKVETWRASTPMLGSEISTVLTARVVLIEEQPTGRTRLTLDVMETRRPTLRYAPERVRVSARSIPGGLAAGDVVSGVVSLMPPSGPVMPGSYDFSFESYFDGIGAYGFFLKGPTLEAYRPAPVGQRFQAWVENARATLAHRIEARIGGPEGEIAAALVAGVRAGIPEDVNEALRRTGLAHVLSISGLHMALVAATIMVTLRLGFAAFPGFASAHPVRKYAAVVAIVALAAYLFISGSAVAAERSFLMIAVMLAALLVDRSALTMRNLAIAAVVVVAISPHEVAGPSFQMSFAATAALIGAYGWWSERRRGMSAPQQSRGPVRQTLRLVLLYGGGLAATSLVAGLATTPYGAFHFQRVSPLSLAANLVAMPVVSALVMPWAVGAMIAMPFGLDGPFLDVMGWGLSLMLGVASWFSERTPLDAVGTVPPIAVMAVTLALVFVTLCTTALRWLALPFAVLAFGAHVRGGNPTILVSEDARLVGVAVAGGLAVNRSRPNSFTVEAWQRAVPAEAIVRPSGGDAQHGVPGQFLCTGKACVVDAADGLRIAWASTATDARALCAESDVLVVDDATAHAGLCGGGMVAVINKRDLALKGAALVSVEDGRQPVVTYAIGEPQRPWHTHRRFSRAARGLPPRERPAVNRSSSGGSVRQAAPEP